MYAFSKTLSDNFNFQRVDKKMSFVQLKDVCKRYKVGEVTISAADKIEFSIEKGELAIYFRAVGIGQNHRSQPSRRNGYRR